MCMRSMGAWQRAANRGATCQAAQLSACPANPLQDAHPVLGPAPHSRPAVLGCLKDALFELHEGVAWGLLDPEFEHQQRQQVTFAFVARSQLGCVFFLLPPTFAQVWEGRQAGSSSAAQCFSTTQEASTHMRSNPGPTAGECCRQRAEQ